MPFLATVYRGCQSCRIRKVKCDVTYPNCQRCEKRGLPCPGVTAVDNAVSRHDTRRTSRKSILTAVTTHTPKSEWPDLPPSVPQDKRQNYLAFFFHRMIVRHGWLAYLPDLYVKSGDNTPLDRFIQAASLLVLGNQRRDVRLQRHGQIAYGEALRSLRAAISDPDEIRKDRTLFAIGVCKVADVGSIFCTKSSELLTMEVGTTRTSIWAKCCSPERMSEDIRVSSALGR